MGSSLVSNSITKTLLSDHRLFKVLNDQLKDHACFNEVLYELMISYIDKYIDFHNLSPKQVSRSYLSFIKSYNKDARIFDDTGKYPLELDINRAEPSRIDYSIILLYSTILTAHRFRIMQLIEDTSLSKGDGLFIGCGPGLEIELVRGKLDKFVAYDLTLDNFLKFHFEDSVIFRNEYFDGSNSNKYEAVYLIEILEHLADPYSLMENCKKVLSPQGKLYLTTATNIPQFDHLYNFESDHIAFEQEIARLGFKIEYAEDIVHGFMTKSIGSMNKFYILTH